jgi:Tfp pilus assembly protein PilF
MAGVYLHMRLLDPAARLLESAVAARVQQQGDAHPALFEPLLDLGAIHYRATRYAQAQETLDRALRVAESAGLTDGPAFARAQVLAGNLQMGRRSWAAAEAAYRRALEIHARGAGAHEDDRTSILNNLGVALAAQARYTEAELVHRQALAAREQEKGAKHFSVAQSLVNLALVARARGHIERAAPLVERALSIRETTYGHEHPSVAEALALRAEVHAASGRAAAAESDCRETLRIRAATLGVAHPETAVAELRLALLLVQRDAQREAQPLAESALAKLQAAEGVDPADLARARDLVAALRPPA